MFVQQLDLDMAHRFIQVGNSKALIIPAKIVKKRGYDLNTEFDIIETTDGFKIVQKAANLDSLVFPQVARPKISDKIKELTGVVHFEQEELEADERLKYILER